MKNSTHPQTELLKYLHSQIGETQKQINVDTSLIGHWENCRGLPSLDGTIVSSEVVDYEINKLILNNEVLNFRFQWLHKRLEEYVPSLNLNN